MARGFFAERCRNQQHIEAASLKSERHPAQVRRAWLASRAGSSVVLLVITLDGKICSGPQGPGKVDCVVT